jgi:homoserine/homoserine lactone efflux protein
VHTHQTSINFENNFICFYQMWFFTCKTGYSYPIMIFEMWIAFIVATIILGLIPGPNIALTVANSVTWGARYGLLNVAGTSTAMIPQLFLTCLGLMTALQFLSEIFEILRWAGVAYLLYLGWKSWSADAVDLTKIKPQPKSTSTIFWRGFLVSTTNPKTLLFYGAFFPQFINPAAAVLPQLIFLSITFLCVITVVDSGWALLAGRARGILATRGTLRNRLSGGLMMLAALGLALARKSQ